MKYLSYLFLIPFLLFFACTEDKDNPTPNENGELPALNKLAVGESANDLLSADKYPQLTIELIAVNGFELDNSVITSFKAFLQERLNKPNGITVRTSSIDSPGLAPYSTDDLRKLEDQLRTAYNTESELTVYLLITEDAFTEENVLGLAYRNTSAALMGGRIRELTGGIGQPSENLVLQTVLRHEIGHLLGLVNVGTPMQTDHMDDPHGHHCDVNDCLMYYAVETGDFLSNLIGANTPPSLDSQCLADLKANGGK